MPARFRHWLGTGLRGNDVLAGIIYGARISLMVGFFSMFLAAVLGTLAGLLAGYFGNHRLKITRGRFVFLVLSILPAWFYSFQLRGITLAGSWQRGGADFLAQAFISLLIFFALLVLFSYPGTWLSRLNWFSKKKSLPVDSWISRLTEVVVSIPVLLLIVIVAAMSKPGMENLIVLIGLLSWPAIARLIRAETMRIAQSGFVQAAIVAGFPHWSILWRYVLPNVISPVLVVIAFGIANAIMVESALSFIGIGVPVEQTTWGSLLSAARNNFSAWWLVVFPGIMLFLTVASFNLIGESIRDSLDNQNTSRS
jgi:peptide/nickel transport system permease protein